MKFQRISLLFLIALVMISPTVLGNDILNSEEENSSTQNGISGDYWPKGEWRSSSPEEQGVDSEPLLRMMNYLKNDQKEIHSLLIIRNGYLITEAYFYPYQKGVKHVINSCAKSITSALVGIAISEGCLNSVNDLVLPYFTDLKVDHTDALKEALTIEHLLTMTTGLDWTEDGSYGSDHDSWTQMWKSKNQIQYILNRPMRSEPGGTFYYCTGASHLLSGILQRTTGKSASDYGREKLFGPIGINDFAWHYDSNGINLGGAGIYLTPADMAKFGYLYLKRGKWDGRQVVPEQWIEASTQKRINTPYGLAGRYGYGYHWWMNGFEGYSARGYGGQYIFVLPKYEMVVVFTSGLSGPDFFLPEMLVDSFIIPSLQPSVKPYKASDKKLTEIIREVGQEPAADPVPPMPEIAEKISGKTFVMDDSTSFSLHFGDSSECRLNIITDGTNYEIPVGLDNVFRVTDLGIGPLPVNKGAFKGEWVNDQTFVITFKSMEDIDELKFFYTFENNEVRTSTFSKMAGFTVQEGRGVMQ